MKMQAQDCSYGEPGFILKMRVQDYPHEFSVVNFQKCRNHFTYSDIEIELPANLTETIDRAEEVFSKRSM